MPLKPAQGPSSPRNLIENEHPIVYISHKLTSKEQPYAVIEGEALTIKLAVEELQGLIEALR